MPGKRPRSIRRTTSVSQLSFRFDPSSHSQDTSLLPPPSTFPSQQVAHTINQSPGLMSFSSQGLPPSAAARPDPRLDSSEICPLNALDDETMGSNADEISAAVSEMMQNGSSMMLVDDLDALNIALDCVNEVHSASPPDRPASPLRSGHLPFLTPSGSPLIHSRSEPSVSIRPVGFLDICFYCKRRLRAGRDIFMYRGDRAFCSIECRYHQMAADERKEKCAVSAAKKGSTSAVTSNTCNQVGLAETAAAA